MLDQLDELWRSQTAAFYKWHGEVHLKGNVCVSQGQHCDGTNHDPTEFVIFTLPEGYRPARTVLFVVASGKDGTEQATVYVQASTGNVVARNFNWFGVDLDG